VTDDLQTRSADASMIVSLETFTANGVWLEPGSRAIESEVLGERFPGLRVPAACVARDDAAAFVEDRDRWVAVEAERTGELEIRIGERRPRPPVLADERLRFTLVVGDVQADELVLRMGVDEPGVGDRLAIADGSPGGPDVDEGGLAAEGREREELAVECLALDLVGDHGWGPCVRATRSVVVPGTAAAGGEHDEQSRDEREAIHRPHRIRRTSHGRKRPH
jgi:hypothetical protein